MKSNRWWQIVTVLLLLFLAIQSGNTLEAQTATPPAPTYEDLLTQGNNLMKGGDLHGAANTAAEAIKLDSNRFEGFVLAALIRYQQNNQVQAQRFLAKAYALAPAGKKAALDKVAAIINTPPVQKAAPVATAPVSAPAPVEDHEMVHQREILKLILADADANSGSARKQFLGEFLTNSAAYVTQYPNDTNIWMLRAVVAVELNDAQAGWEAGQKMKAMGLDDSDNPAVIKVMAALERKNWMGSAAIQATLDGAWEGWVDYSETSDQFLAHFTCHQYEKWRIIVDPADDTISVVLLDYNKSVSDANDSKASDPGLWCSAGCVDIEYINQGPKFHNVNYQTNSAEWNFYNRMDFCLGMNHFRSKNTLPAKLTVAADGNSATFTESGSFDNDAFVYKANGTFQRVPNAISYYKLKDFY